MCLPQYNGENFQVSSLAFKFRSINEFVDFLLKEGLRSVDSVNENISRCNSCPGYFILFYFILFHFLLIF